MRALTDRPVLAAKRDGQYLTYRGRLIVGTERDLVLTFARGQCIELHTVDPGADTVTLAEWETAERARLAVEGR